MAFFWFCCCMVRCSGRYMATHRAPAPLFLIHSAHLPVLFCTAGACCWAPPAGVVLPVRVSLNGNGRPPPPPPLRMCFCRRFCSELPELCSCHRCSCCRCSQFGAGRVHPPQQRPRHEGHIGQPVQAEEQRAPHPSCLSSSHFLLYSHIILRHCRVALSPHRALLPTINAPLPPHLLHLLC